MTPKEKAIELQEQFKEKSILVVEEIIESYKAIYDDFIMNTEKYDKYRNMEKYWNDVAQELLILNS